MEKHPGGWETALAVKHFLKRNSSGAVAPYAFYDEHYLKFCRSKLNDFEGMSWYLQGFVVVAGWKPFPCSSLEVSGISMVPSPLPNPYSLKQLRVHSTIFTYDTAPLDIFHIPSMPPVCTSKFPHFIFLVMQKMPLL